MKSVTANSLVVQPAGYGVVIRDLVVVAVKGRIEAGDLRQSGKIGEQRFGSAPDCGADAAAQVP